jgi:uncharacterized protein YheU (UPF0270 family)
VEIPYKELNAETLNKVIESFVLREGTDYGHADYSLDTKVKRVMKQLENGYVKIYFDAETQSIDLAQV